MKYIKWMILFILIVVVVIFGRSDEDKIISGTVRADFIESSNNTCLMDLIENPKFNEVLPETLASYCSCTSNRVADQLTNSEVTEISKRGSLSEEMRERFIVVTEPCREILLGL